MLLTKPTGTAVKPKPPAAPTNMIGPPVKSGAGGSTDGGKLSNFGRLRSAAVNKGQQGSLMKAQPTKPVGGSAGGSASGMSTLADRLKSTKAALVGARDAMSGVSRTEQPHRWQALKAKRANIRARRDRQQAKKQGMIAREIA